MPKNKLVLIGFGALAICVASVGFFVWAWDSGDSSHSQSDVEGNTTPDLGITYVTLNDTVAECYGLEFNCGALLTDVEDNGAADRAGMKVGDVILSCDGVKLDESTPLLGIIREHERAGSSVTLEVARGTRIETVQVPQQRSRDTR